MSPRPRIYATSMLVFAFLQATHALAQFTTSPFSPQGRLIEPFGYGPVLQYFIPSSGRTGSSICHGVSPALSCISVSGGTQCASQAPANSLISCNSSVQAPVDETAFQPVNCRGQGTGDGGASGLVGSNDWCLIANYMPQRTVDTIYQYNDYVRLGVNKRFGGMITELYGTDKVDRILQNGGGGVQLSLWAFTTGYAPAAYPRAYFEVGSVLVSGGQSYDPTPFPTLAGCQAAHPGHACVLGVEGPNELSGPPTYPCAGNGEGAGAPLNPIQGQSVDCDYGLPQGAVDSVQSTAPGKVTVVKAGPANFSRSDNVPWVSWRQTSQVSGPAAILTYLMTGTASIPDMDFQEIPAVILHQGIGTQVYYYAGTSPYGDVDGNVSTTNIASATVPLVMQLPHRVGPFGTGANIMLTEDWVSTCDASATKCVTVATFSGTSQDMVAIYGTGGTYFGVHGFFSLSNGLNRTVTTLLFPYRFDDIVQGRSIRAWIYSMHANPQYTR